jgi:hypothetical protein
VLGFSCCVSVAGAQAPVLTLRPPTAVLDHGFSRVESVRELSDGRVLVTDVGDDVLAIVDLVAGTVRPLASRGAGPGEYRDLGRLIALRGDSTLMGDASNRRALILVRDAVAVTLAADDPLLATLGTDLVGADTADRVFGLRALPPANLAATPRRDPVALLSYSRRSGAVDTIVVLRGMEMHTRAVGTPPTQRFMTSTAIMSSPEQAAVFAGGEVAVALQDPYRVDWYATDEGVRRGSPIERTAPPLDEAEKLAWKRRQEEWSGRPLTFALDRFPWATTVPPFRQGALTPLPDGRLLIAREPWSGRAANVFDVADSTGARVGTLTLPPGSRLIGTGRGVVFVASTDSDGIERLSRHPWP